MRARIPSVRPRTSRPRSRGVGRGVLVGHENPAPSCSDGLVLMDKAAGAYRLRISGTLRGSAREGAVRISDL
jgi:hypothetical protein